MSHKNNECIIKYNGCSYILIYNSRHSLYGIAMFQEFRWFTLKK